MKKEKYDEKLETLHAIMEDLDRSDRKQNKRYLECQNKMTKYNKKLQLYKNRLAALEDDLNKYMNKDTATDQKRNSVPNVETEGGIRSTIIKNLRGIRPGKASKTPDHLKSDAEQVTAALRAESANVARAAAAAGGTSGRAAAQEAQSKKIASPEPRDLPAKQPLHHKLVHTPLPKGTTQSTQGGVPPTVHPAVAAAALGSTHPALDGEDGGRRGAGPMGDLPEQDEDEAEANAPGRDREQSQALPTRSRLEKIKNLVNYGKNKLQLAKDKKKAEPVIEEDESKTELLALLMDADVMLSQTTPTLESDLKQLRRQFESIVATQAELSGRLSRLETESLRQEERLVTIVDKIEEEKTVVSQIATERYSGLRERVDQAQTGVQQILDELEGIKEQTRKCFEGIEASHKSMTEVSTSVQQMEQKSNDFQPYRWRSIVEIVAQYTADLFEFASRSSANAVAVGLGLVLLLYLVMNVLLGWIAIVPLHEGTRS